jgi:hypothetical protein
MHWDGMISVERLYLLELHTPNFLSLPHLTVWFHVGLDYVAQYGSVLVTFFLRTNLDWVYVTTCTVSAGYSCGPTNLSLLRKVQRRALFTEA